MPYRFTTQVPLRWVDVDSEGVVNNAVYLSLMEQARFVYFEQLGLLPQRRVGFLLAEATVRYRRPGRLGMNTEVAARTVRLGGRSCVMEYEVRGDGEVLATGTAALVFVDAGLRPCAVPDAVRTAISGFEGIAARAEAP